MKLYLGCGLDKRPGYVNVDIRESVKPDVVWDLEKFPYPFGDESAEEILAIDIIEHLSFHKVEQAIREIWRILKKGGRLHIRCPDLEILFKKVVLNPNADFKEMSFWIYGAQDYPENFHKSGFTKRTLRELLEKVGFKIESIGDDGGTNIICWAIKP